MPNRLADALSPYLEQHAHNPVDWYPWGPEALQAARTSDRPILLSIGYSACHWCHVMAHESFDNEAIAERMNAWFVNIKVDREERPDLDRVYQLAHQLLTGRGGGWPLTVFLDSSDLKPFVAGTYFPPESRHGLIGFDELLERVHSAWLNQRETLRAQNEQLGQALEMLSGRRDRDGDHAVDDDPQETLLGQLAGRCDRRHGGFGDAPKFPQAPLLAWLQRKAVGDEGAAEMLNDTLRAMARNGLFDQIGGGFFRYCVDAAWEIPHFEKMLYDNALLLPLYAEAAVRWNESEWVRVAELTVSFLERDMRLETGGLASSLDADSVPPDPDPGAPAEPSEGAFYLWKPAQVDACLGSEGAELAKARFGLDGPPNFEGEQWHLVLARSVGELTGAAADARPMREELEAVRKRLHACRAERPPPGRDDKMVAAWNAHAAEGLMRAGGLLGEPDWTRLGCETLDLTWRRLFEDPPARAVWRDGRSASPALLDDHAGMLSAALERLSAAWDAQWLDRAETLAEGILERFYDGGDEMLFLTPSGHERLIMRPTAHLDESLPAAAAVTARGLLRLGHLTASGEWLALAGRIVDAARGDTQRAPAAHAAMLQASLEIQQPRPMVLIGGEAPDADDWHARLRRDPDVDAYRVDGDADALPETLADVAERRRTTAIVCAGMRCLAPAESLDALELRLAEVRGERGGQS